MAKIDGLAPRPMPKRAAQGMRKFTVYRHNDQTGVSGTGIVAEGVEFACGHIAIKWLTPLPHGDLQIKESLDAFLKIHVIPHPENLTVITFEDGEQQIYPSGAQIPAEEKIKE